MKDDESILASARAILVRYLGQKGMRRTPERFAILEKAFSFEGHFYADTLWEAMEQNGYHVSLSTVYSAVKLLTESGLLRRHQFGDQPAQYERVVPDAPSSHYHLVCSSCGRVREVKDAETLRMLDARRYPTFQPSYCVVYVYGLCSRCLKKQRKLEREKASERTKS